MAERFLKYIPCKIALDLARKHPNAFILLMFIAERARRETGELDGLKPGECHIGDWDSYGFSRQNYRTALKVLVINKFVEILETNRTRKKLTIGVTTEGTKVKLLDSRIWDINSEDINHRPNHCPTTAQPLPNHEQEREECKEREEKKDIAQPAKKRPRSKDSLSFDFDSWKFIGITENDTEDWRKMYPSIDLDVEILRASHWLRDNPSKSKKTLWRKYLTGWLKRSNEWIENKKAYQGAKTSAQQDRRTKDIEGNPVENQHKGKF